MHRNLADFAAMCVRSALQLTAVVALVASVTPFTLSCLAPVLLAFGLLYAYFQMTDYSSSYRLSLTIVLASGGKQ